MPANTTLFSGRITPNFVLFAPPAYHTHPWSYSSHVTAISRVKGSVDVSPPTQKNSEKYALYLPIITLIGITLFSEFRHTETALDPAAHDHFCHKWDKEIQAHKHIHSAWVKELAEHDKEHEEIERMKGGFYWVDLQADQHCFRHDTRQYTTQVSNVTQEYDPMQACKETPIKIQGLKFLTPDMCKDIGCNGVFSHWVVSHSEPTCTTYFRDFKDQGCTPPGTRQQRIESHLENLHPEDDWRLMCSTTPADFWYLHFDTPHMCENWGKYGIWGIWEINDSRC
ncbi:hypothetical protein DFH08DRAFT_886245 [Mycena albidolilacea]|uniref:Uncharacterized protein n=1 Tax=Mycena albidolilacea TaxID=1033008 RepID=A0AAD7EJ05_9AGAR|nr:hypothetical protein DFH08DRAFT_886245 [Mycena albidolilacea]